MKTGRAAMPKQKRFSLSDVETIRWMAARGHSGIQIARTLRRDPLSIRHKACALGIRLRPERAKTRLRILIEAAIYQALIDAAQRRGTTAPKLARLLLITILSDGLIDAILDVPRSGKAKPIVKKRRQSA